MTPLTLSGSLRIYQRKSTPVCCDSPNESQRNCHGCGQLPDQHGPFHRPIPGVLENPPRSGRGCRCSATRSLGDTWIARRDDGGIIPRCAPERALYANQRSQRPYPGRPENFGRWRTTTVGLESIQGYRGGRAPLYASPARDSTYTVNRERESTYASACRIILSALERSNQLRKKKAASGCGLVLREPLKAGLTWLRACLCRCCG
jgi:hypothetical protein